MPWHGVDLPENVAPVLPILTSPRRSGISTKGLRRATAAPQTAKGGTADRDAGGVQLPVTRIVFLSTVVNPSQLYDSRTRGSMLATATGDTLSDWRHAQRL
jgi:hypothetical protein